MYSDSIGKYLPSYLFLCPLPLTNNGKRHLKKRKRGDWNAQSWGYGVTVVSRRNHKQYHPNLIKEQIGTRVPAPLQLP